MASDYRAYDRSYDREDDRSSFYYDRERDRDDDRPRRHKSTRTRPRERGEPEYVEETTFVERGKGPPPKDLMIPPREREDSIEEVTREFPPPSRSVRGYREDYDDAPPRRSRSAYGSRRSTYEEDDYDDYAGGAAGGAAAGYAAGRRGGKGRDRRSRRDRDGYYSDDYERYSERDESRSRSPRRHERKKSGIEEALEGLGLGGIAGTIMGKARSSSRPGSRRGRDSSDDDSRGGSRAGSKSRGDKKQRQWAQAAQAAIVAGAVEAFRARNDPGPWTGEKGRRIATAAIASGGIDRIADRNPDKKSKIHLAEAVLGGLAANRLANGPHHRSDSRGRSESAGGGLRSRSRSIIDRFRSKSRGRSARGSDDGSPDRHRSQSRGGVGGGLKGLAAGGALAAAGKAIYDRVRSKSRGPGDRKRSTSRSGSDDSYGRSASRSRSRSRGRRDVGKCALFSRSCVLRAWTSVANAKCSTRISHGPERTRSR